jgi:hypothetical protein
LPVNHSTFQVERPSLLPVPITVVSYAPLELKGDINKARIFLYASTGIAFETGMQPMDVSYDNIALYELPGTYDLIEGKSKFIMLEENKKVTRQEFIVSMRQ